VKVTCFVLYSEFEEGLEFFDGRHDRIGIRVTVRGSSI